MATFEGTIQEWHKYLGHYLKNKVTMLYRSARKARRGECELDSAHKHGRDRKTIINSILEKHLRDGVICCDIGAVADEILGEHTVSDLLFLCRSCHWLYDNPPKPT